MKYRSGSKTSLFLIELIITIFFFSMAGVVCIRLFLNAHQLSLRTYEQTHAAKLAFDAAECFIAAHGDPDDFEKLWQLTWADKEQTDAISRNAVFNISSGDDGIRRLEIHVHDDNGRDIYTLEVLDYP